MILTRQDEEEERAHVGAARGGPEAEEGGLESRLPPILRPQSGPPAGQLCRRGPVLPGRGPALFSGPEADADAGAP